MDWRSSRSKQSEDMAWIMDRNDLLVSVQDIAGVSCQETLSLLNPRNKSNKLTKAKGAKSARPNERGGGVKQQPLPRYDEPQRQGGAVVTTLTSSMSSTSGVGTVGNYGKISGGFGDEIRVSGEQSNLSMETTYVREPMATQTTYKQRILSADSFKTSFDVHVRNKDAVSALLPANDGQKDAYQNTQFRLGTAVTSNIGCSTNAVLTKSEVPCKRCRVGHISCSRDLPNCSACAKVGQSCDYVSSKPIQKVRQSPVPILGNDVGLTKTLSQRACTRCKDKHIRCDKTMPQCSNCSIAGGVCNFGDSIPRTPPTQIVGKRKRVGFE